MGFFNKTHKRCLKQKSEHHHRVFYIRNRLGIKFQVKLTILNFLIKLTQIEYS